MENCGANRKAQGMWRRGGVHGVLTGSGVESLWAE